METATVRFQPEGRSATSPCWVLRYTPSEILQVPHLPVQERNKYVMLEIDYQSGRIDKSSPEWEDIMDSQWSHYFTRRRQCSFYLGETSDPAHVRSWQQIVDRFEQGWPEGAAKALKLADGLIDQVSQPLSIRRRTRWADDGDEFDKERLLNGHLDTCWRTSSRQIAVATPIIHVLSGWGGNAGRSHDQLFWTGAAALALVKILEEAGYQTKLSAMCTTTKGYDEGVSYTAQICTLKDAGEYVRPDAIASIVCWGTAFRIFCFQGIIANPHHNVGVDSLGSYISVDTLIPPAIESGLLEPPQVVIPDCYNEQSAKRAIRQALRDLADANLAALPLTFDMEGQL